MRKGKVYSKLLLSIATLAMIFIFTACGSDDDKASFREESEYKAEVIFEGNLEGFRKYVTIQGGGMNSLPADLINEETGKILPSSTLADENYEFKNINKFSLSKDVAYFFIMAGANASVSATGTIKVTVKIYRDGKLIDTIEDTGAGEPNRKNAKIEKTYLNEEL